MEYFHCTLCGVLSLVPGLYDNVIVTLLRYTVQKMETSLENQIKTSLKLQEKYKYMYVVFSVAKIFWFLCFGQLS